jgi:hypothetical protein
MCAAPVEELRQPVKIDARKLRRIHRMPAARRAFWAYDLETETVTISRLRRAQSTSLTKASRGYVSTIASLDAATRERVRVNPFLLTHFHNQRELTDAADDAFVARVGAQRLWAAFDRLTAPATPKVQIAAE